jgi:hypothetical protein
VFQNCCQNFTEHDKISCTENKSFNKNRFCVSPEDKGLQRLEQRDHATFLVINKKTLDYDMGNCRVTFFGGSFGTGCICNKIVQKFFWNIFKRTYIFLLNSRIVQST